MRSREEAGQAHAGGGGGGMANRKSKNRDGNDFLLFLRFLDLFLYLYPSVLISVYNMSFFFIKVVVYRWYKEGENIAMSYASSCNIDFEKEFSEKWRRMRENSKWKHGEREEREEINREYEDNKWRQTYF